MFTPRNILKVVLPLGVTVGAYFLLQQYVPKDVWMLTAAAFVVSEVVGSFFRWDKPKAKVI